MVRPFNNKVSKSGAKVIRRLNIMLKITYFDSVFLGTATFKLS